MNPKKLLLALLVLTLGGLGLTTSYGNEKSESKHSSLMKCGDIEKETKQIEQLLKSYFAALNTSDAQIAVASYAKDGVFMPTEGPTATGLEQLKAAYRHVFDTIKLNVNFKIDEIVPSGEYAYAMTSSDGEVTLLSKGVTVPEKNRELFVLKKVDGDWKIARYMFNKSSRSQ
jgi:uncharacterized protein (TIGR02246 family)